MEIRNYLLVYYVLRGCRKNGKLNDDGVISPTAAISSLPYTPKESMDTLKFFYYKLGDKIWGQYGFTDALILLIFGSIVLTWQLIRGHKL